MVLSCVSGPEKSASQEPHVFKVRASFPFPDGVLRSTEVLSFGEVLLIFFLLFRVVCVSPLRNLRET